MNTTKWIVVAACVPLMAACEEESGQCVRPVNSPTAAPAVVPSEVPSQPPPISSAGGAASAGAPAIASAPTAASAAPIANAPTGAGPAAIVATESPAAAAPRSIQGTVTATPERAAAFAVVYLADAPIDPKRGMKVMVDQRAMAFIPYTAAMAAGGTATFLNSDPFPHNVFSPNGQKFNIGMISQGQSRSVTLHQPGDYALLCNVHPGMLGHLFVAPSSYFAVADAHGKYAIKDVPEGTYKVSVWAGKFVADEQTAKLQGADVTVDFALHK